MSFDRSGHAAALSSHEPLIASLAEDDLLACRIESALDADGLYVTARASGVHEQVAGRRVDADVLVVAVGSGVTQRDEQIRHLRRHLPEACIVAIMPEDSRRGVRRALEAGAEGVVFESDLERTLAIAVRATLAGQTVVPAARRHEVGRPTLSSREKQVLGLVVSGKSNKSIARELFLAESTVKCHLSSVFSKLGVRSRNEAVDLILNAGSAFDFSQLVPAATRPPRAASHDDIAHVVRARDIGMRRSPGPADRPAVTPSVSPPNGFAAAPTTAEEMRR